MVRPIRRIASTYATGYILKESRDFPAKSPSSGECASVHVRLDDALAASFVSKDAGIGDSLGLSPDMKMFLNTGRKLNQRVVEFARPPGGGFVGHKGRYDLQNGEESRNNLDGCNESHDEKKRASTFPDPNGLQV